MMVESKRLLFSLAHPDDESFGSAGTIAHYTASGVDVHLICATNGDMGTIDDAYMEGFSSIAERRMSELACAAEVLGLTVHTLGYRDSGMQGAPENDHPDALASQDIEDVARRVTRVIREVRPQVVVTFDPTGGYFHPDHIAIHRATTLAFEAAGDPARFPEQLDEGLEPYQPQKLYYTVFDFRFVRFALRLAPLFGIDPTHMGRNKDMNYKAVVEAERGDTDAIIRVGKYRETMQEAWHCHASQREETSDSLVTWMIRKVLGGDDHYSRAYPPANGGVREHDLFADVVLEEAEAV